MTNAVLNLSRSSNVGLNGRWVFRVDEIYVRMPDVVPLPAVSLSLATTLLYPFGSSQGDNNGPFNDCGNGFAEVNVLPSGFLYFKKVQMKIFIQVNGFLTFTAGRIDAVTFNPFWTSFNYLAVFFTNVDHVCGTNRVTGDVFFRVSTDKALLSRAKNDVSLSFVKPDLKSFTPTWLLIVTWSDVTFQTSSSPSPTPNIKNTFQVVLVTDGMKSFVLLNYGSLTWTTGFGNGQDAQGRGGTQASVGFNAGDAKIYYTLPGSMTADVLQLAQNSNVGLPGRWIYRVDGLNVGLPNYPSRNVSGVQTQQPSEAQNASSFLVGVTNTNPAVSPPTEADYVLCDQVTDGLIANGSIVNVQCPRGLPPSRYAFVKKPSSGRLKFCELQVFAQGYAWVRRQNSKLNYGIREVFVADYPSQCQWTCYTDDLCDSVNYRPMDRTCQLLAQYSPSRVNFTDIVSDSDWEWWSHEFTTIVQ